MLDNLELQARTYFFLSFLSERPDATAQEALAFSEKCWQEFQAETRESWLADIRALLHRRAKPAAAPEATPHFQVQTRSASASFAHV